MNNTTKLVFKYLGIGLLVLIALVGVVFFQVKQDFKQAEKEFIEELEEQASTDNLQLPDGVPIYPNSQVVNVSRILGTYKFTTTDSPTDVITFYTEYFRSKNSQYQISPIENGIYVANPTDPERQFISRVIAKREGNETSLLVQFPSQ